MRRTCLRSRGPSEHSSPRSSRRGEAGAEHPCSARPSRRATLAAERGGLLTRIDELEARVDASDLGWIAHEVDEGRAPRRAALWRRPPGRTALRRLASSAAKTTLSPQKRPFRARSSSSTPVVAVKGICGASRSRHYEALLTKLARSQTLCLYLMCDHLRPRRRHDGEAHQVDCSGSQPRDRARDVPVLARHRPPPRPEDAPLGEIRSGRHSCGTTSTSTPSLRNLRRNSAPTSPSIRRRSGLETVVSSITITCAPRARATAASFFAARRVAATCPSAVGAAGLQRADRRLHPSPALVQLGLRRQEARMRQPERRAVDLGDRDDRDRPGRRESGSPRDRRPRVVLTPVRREHDLDRVRGLDVEAATMERHRGTPRTRVWVTGDGLSPTHPYAGPPAVGSTAGSGVPRLRSSSIRHQ